MKAYHRLKRTTKQYIIVALLCVIVIGGAASITAFIITNQIKEEYQTLLDQAYQDMAKNKREVYVSTENIYAGELLTNNNVKRVTVYSSQPQESYITLQEIGKLALIDIPADTQVMTTMVTDNSVSSELREMEYQVISIGSNIGSNDTVDIRIVYPNGESYIVLSKKMIKGIAEGSLGCYLWMKEEEILRMSAAIVDAGLYTGSQLITTKYIEPSIQEASSVTYTPGLAILSLLERDPNILERCSQKLSMEIRKALENRLASSMSANISEINWKVDPNVGAVEFPEPSPEAEQGDVASTSVSQASEQNRDTNMEHTGSVDNTNTSMYEIDSSVELNNEKNIENKNDVKSNNENSINHRENNMEHDTEDNTIDSNTETDRAKEIELGTTQYEKDYFKFVEEDVITDYIEYGE